MTTITCDQTISIDGFTAGVNQTADKPFGDDPAERLHRWMFEEAEANAEVLAEITAAGAFITGCRP